MDNYKDENEMKNNNEDNPLENSYEDNDEGPSSSESNMVNQNNMEETANKSDLSGELEHLRKSSNRRDKKRIMSGTLAGIVLGSALTLGATYAFLPNMLSMRGISFNEADQEITINPTQDLTVYSAVAKKVMPSVVGITTVEVEEHFFFGPTKTSGVGTGVIVDERGYILTNSHVVGDGNAEEVTVLFHDGKQLKADVLWNETALDLAIIKVEGSGFKAAELGNSDEIEVGGIAIAIGNPLGLDFERSLTQGVISGLNRTIKTSSGAMENLIQTDASINPGNSGGPLLNEKGQVIGINTAKVSSGEGLGFAIPINTAKPIVDQFIENGEFTRVYLGIRGVGVDQFEQAIGEEVGVDKGVYVVQVDPDGMANKYDIRAGDIITQIDDKEVTGMSNLVKVLYNYRPGDKATVTVLRNNEEVKIDVVFE